MKRQSIDGKLYIMDIQDILKELVKKNGLRQTARELGMDSSTLFRSIHSDLRVGTAQLILNRFGYELKVVRKGGERVHGKVVRKFKKEVV